MYSVVHKAFKIFLFVGILFPLLGFATIIWYLAFPFGLVFNLTSSDSAEEFKFNMKDMYITIPKKLWRCFWEDLMW